MGILNVTPDSFSDGGRFDAPEAAIVHAKSMAMDGADIIDIGGESTRPKAEGLTADEEWRRIGAVIEALREEGEKGKRGKGKKEEQAHLFGNNFSVSPFPHFPFSPLVSIDTYHAQTAREALRLGVGMINDITALRHDPEMASVVAEAGCECVLMHMQGTPQTMQDNPRYDDVVDDIRAFFDERLAYATARGIKEESIWLDPGFGFGKTVEHNLEILRRLNEFKKLGRPILVGTSNKGTIGAVLGTPVGERTEGTAATVAIAIMNGADCVRVHDVKAMARVAKMTDAVVRG